jgi:hypothetical protein
MHGVMIMSAMASGLGVMVCDGGTVLAAGCNGGRQLQPGALSPSRRAGDQRKRDSQDQDMVKNTTHVVMLAGPAESRQKIFD